MLVSASSTTLVFAWKKNSGRPEGEICTFASQKAQNFLKGALARVVWKAEELTELTAGRQRVGGLPVGAAVPTVRSLAISRLGDVVSIFPQDVTQQSWFS